MTTIRRVLSTLAPVALGAMLMAGSAAATPITVTISVFGDIPSFTLGGANTSTSVSKFDAAAVNLAIQGACATGHTCTPLTLNEIDFTLNSTTDVTLNAQNNSTTALGYIAPIGYLAGVSLGQNGTFGSPASALNFGAANIVTASDSITTGLAVAHPTLIVNGNTTAKRTTCSTTGSAATSANYLNCLSIATGGKTFTGTVSDAGVGVYLATDTNWGTVLGQYVGTGTTGFTLSSTISTANGPTFGLAGLSNVATEQLIAGGFEVDYTYTYDDTANSGVPEPTTMALMGIALLGVGLVRRRSAR